MKYPFICLLLLLCCRLTAQEEITPLYRNTITPTTETKAGRGPGDTLQLPFIDDFSGSRHFPDPKKWLDKRVFINSTFPISPPSIGVATFDALDDAGYAYVPNQPLAYGGADTLTSKPIDLSLLTPADSIYFSFAYQPQGIGNEPQAGGTTGQTSGDSLILEFKRSGTWTRVWGITGAANRAFRNVILPLNDPAYFTGDFQFRFCNYASLAGSFDHWHIDYIYLDEDRHVADTVFQDLAFSTGPQSLLKNYHEMPWSQYVQNKTGETKDTMVIHVKNNYNQITPSGYQYIIRDESGAVIAQSTGLSGNFHPGQQLRLSNHIAALSSGFPDNGSQTREFEITNIITPPADFNRDNDTVVTFQRFDCHFAYDDGSAEAGYSLNAVGAQLAYKFTLYTQQRLMAIAVHWNFANNDVSESPFRFRVWDDENGKPGVPLMTKDSVWYPKYDGVNGYQIYYLNNMEIDLSGTFHIGWMQEFHDDRLNVGFDMNRDHQDKIHFNTTGAWQPSATPEKGALMIRPIFCDPSIPVGTPEPETELTFDLYPNPATDQVIFSTSVPVKQYLILDITGRVVANGQVNSPAVNTALLKPGIYFFQVVTASGRSSTKRLIIQR